MDSAPRLEEAWRPSSGPSDAGPGGPDLRRQLRAPRPGQARRPDERLRSPHPGQRARGGAADPRHRGARVVPGDRGPPRCLRKRPPSPSARRAAQQHRTERGLSQAQAARELDVARTAYRLWEMEAAKPSPDRWRLIARWLGVSISTMLLAEDLIDAEDAGAADDIAGRSAGSASKDGTTSLRRTPETSSSRSARRSLARPAEAWSRTSNPNG